MNSFAVTLPHELAALLDGYTDVGATEPEPLAGAVRWQQLCQQADNTTITFGQQDVDVLRQELRTVNDPNAARLLDGLQTSLIDVVCQTFTNDRWQTTYDDTLPPPWCWQAKLGDAQQAKLLLQRMQPQLKRTTIVVHDNGYGLLEAHVDHDTDIALLVQSAQQAWPQQERSGTTAPRSGGLLGRWKKQR